MIPVIFGPTAVGKTSASLEMAHRLEAQIISADSMQVYRGMDIGTAKLPEKERQGIPHHLIDIKSPDEIWNVHLFLQNVQALLSNTSERYIIVGGTGLYIQSLLYGHESSDTPASPSIRAFLNDRISREGLETLYRELQGIDPVAAKRIHPHNTPRILRAIEVYMQTGRPFSSIQKKRDLPDPRFQLILLTRERHDLYLQIEKRVDDMIRLGLVDEVRTLLEQGYSPRLPSLQALGYKEIIAHLQGAITLEEAIRQIKQGTKHFARRQLTWARRWEKNRVN